MPTIQFSKSPNEDTAFVVQDDGVTKNRALLTAPQDTSTLELPSNPNSTKGYVTIDGKKHRVVLTADIGGGGGGGEVDYNRVIEKSSSIPTAGSDEYRKVYMYVGTTNATYTHGYIYECQKTSTTYTGTVSFEAATLSGTTVACDGDVFANFLTEAGADPTPIVSGTMTYDSGADGWRLVGKDAEDNTITNFIEYTEDYTDAGFTFTGTPQDGDVVAFTCTVSEASSTYSWVRLDVQPTVDPLPSQTGNAGKFLTTDGTDASWSDKPLANLATGTSSLSIMGEATARPSSVVIGELAKGAASSGSACVAVGVQAKATGNGSTAIGKGSEAIDTECVAIGNGAHAYGIGSVQIKYGTNNTPNTVQIGSYTVMSADGTIPTDRLTKVNTTITLTAAGWSSNTQTVSVTGMTANGVVFPSPDPADQSAYTSAGILCTAQAAGTLTFTCDTVPSADIDVNVVML